MVNHDQLRKKEFEDNKEIRKLNDKLIESLELELSGESGIRFCTGDANRIIIMPPYCIGVGMSVVSVGIEFKLAIRKIANRHGLSVIWSDSCIGHFNTELAEKQLP